MQLVYTFPTNVLLQSPSQLFKDDAPLTVPHHMTVANNHKACEKQSREVYVGPSLRSMSSSNSQPSQTGEDGVYNQGARSTGKDSLPNYGSPSWFRHFEETRRLGITWLVGVDQ